MKMTNISALLSALERTGLDQVSKSKAMHLMLAAAIAWRLPMVTSPLKSDSLHYVENLRGQALDMIDAFNEVQVINVTVTDNLVKQFWTARYRAIFNPEHSIVNGIIRSLFSTDHQESGFGKTLSLLSDEQMSDLNYYTSRLFETEGE